jgi:guanylate kinase
MKKGRFIVVSGPSGVGKGTICNTLINELDAWYSVSMTTRGIRDGEVDGVNYYFISMEEFLKRIATGDMLEYTEYCGNYYGTLKSELSKLDEGKNLILEIEVEGAMNIKRLFPESVTVFILPPDYDTLKSRLVNRGTNTEADIENRMKRALEEFVLVSNYDYLVVNDDGKAQEAADAIYEIVKSEQHRSLRNADAMQKLFFNK